MCKKCTTVRYCSESCRDENAEEHWVKRCRYEKPWPLVKLPGSVPLHDKGLVSFRSLARPEPVKEHDRAFESASASRESASAIIKRLCVASPEVREECRRIKCRFCGDYIEKTSTDDRERKVEYCSVKCTEEHYSVHGYWRTMTGENESFISKCISATIMGFVMTNNTTQYVDQYVSRTSKKTKSVKRQTLARKINSNDKLREHDVPFGTDCSQNDSVLVLPDKPELHYPLRQLPNCVNCIYDSYLRMYTCFGRPKCHENNTFWFKEGERVRCEFCELAGGDYYCHEDVHLKFVLPKSDNTESRT